MVNDSYILNHFNSVNLDIRETKDGTWIDQKCTMDVVAYVADSIVAYVSDCEELGEIDPVFSIKTIWNQDYSKENMYIFGKRPVEIKDSEYDKFFGQPIKMLRHADVIQIHHKHGNQLFFTVKDIELLEYISQSERKALNFLQLYITEVLKSSGIFSEFENFFEKQNQESYLVIKRAFESLMITHTGKGKKGGDASVECNRIFTKVLNPIAFKYGKRGSEAGDISEDIIQQSDLIYNRKNFRDIAIGKPKNVSRNEYESTLPDEILEARVEYEIVKAKKSVKRYNKKVNSGLSECLVEYSINIDGVDYLIEIEEVKKVATQMHHIFPKHSYPNIAACLENLIALSPNQHVLYAHPEGRTQEINRVYQYYLLMCKVDRVRRDESGFYSFSNLVNVLNTGFETDEFGQVEENDYIKVMELIKTYY